jgi:hypothetical protein
VVRQDGSLLLVVLPIIVSQGEEEEKGNKKQGMERLEGEENERSAAPSLVCHVMPCLSVSGNTLDTLPGMLGLGATRGGMDGWVNSEGGQMVLKIVTCTECRVWF